MIRWITLRRLGTAVLMTLAILAQGTWALAGTTGGLSGTVMDAQKGTPVANAVVTVTSPSQASSVHTDSSGHFSFVSLFPDTYSISVIKDGFAPFTLSGVSIFADNTQTISAALQPAMKTIANVTSRSAGNLVKPGVTSDVYSVNAATQQAVQGVGGGKNLDSAYSAIYSTPGVTSIIGNYGFGQVFYIRGGNYDQSGYEYDGVPVNRAFDNYNANSLSNLGQQELQVYTGGTPAGASSATLSGFINQVIKTGTYPGFGLTTVGIGAPAFYHKFIGEAGGASPNRLFSYYVGFQGFNVANRAINNKEGADLGYDDRTDGLFGAFTEPVPSILASWNNNGPWATCGSDGLAPAGAATFAGVPACNTYLPYTAAVNALNTNREVTMNLHFGLPHKYDGGKDDIQLLYNDSAYHSVYANSINDLGGPAYFSSAFNAFAGPSGLGEAFVGPYAGESGPYSGYCGYRAVLVAVGLANTQCIPNGPSPVPYQDGYIFRSGTAFGQPAATAVAVPYFFPNSPTNRSFGGAIAPTDRDAVWNDGAIVKIQYQRNINPNSYLRAFGYSFYSDWLQNGPNVGSQYYGTSGFLGLGPVSFVDSNYELNTHTRGFELQYANQINAQNLLTLTGNYTTATVNRFRNSATWLNTLRTSATNLADASGNCYNATTGALASCFSGSTAGSFGTPVGATPPAGSPAALAGAAWMVTVPSGNGTLNKVAPKFTSAAIQDRWNPTNRVAVDLGLRYERYEYDLSDLNNPEYNFWFTAAQKSYCYDPATGQPLVRPLAPTIPIAGSTALSAVNCPIAPSGQLAVHPDGQGGHLLYTNVGQPNLTKTLVSPRFGATFSLSPESVLRVSAGRYSQPTPTAFEQYLNQSGRGAANFDFVRFFGLGFTTPVHDNPVQVSNNFDASFEHRFKGTDVTVKLTPFYRDTKNQSVFVSLGPSFVSAVNVGHQKSSGVEFALSKGSVGANGWSGQLSYTYTHAKIQYAGIGSLNHNTIDTLNSYITAYNKLTQAGGGAPCYDPSAVAPDAPGGVGNAPSSCAAATDIKNPYYSLNPQPLLDRNGWYETYPNAPPGDPYNSGVSAIAPHVFAGFLSYKHDKLMVTPTFQVNAGVKYGAPTDIIGNDPRNCASNQATSGVVSAASPAAQYADYQTCSFSPYTATGYFAVPNPYSGTFDGMAQYREPWQYNIGAQIQYDFSPKITGTLLLANIANGCFGGDKTPWSNTYKPGRFVCGYAASGGTFVGTQPGAGFFYGTSPSDPANGTASYPGAFNYPYVPFTAAIPLQAYFDLHIRL